MDIAVWIVRALVAEIIATRREHRAVFLPAGPLFELDGAVADIVGACAKTFDYWVHKIAAVDHHHDDELATG